MYLNIDSKLFPISFPHTMFTNEFHVASSIRKKYKFSEEFFTISGNVVFANFAQVRKFVAKFNEGREETKKIKVSEVNASGLIDEIFHFVIRYYDEKINPNVF